MTGYGAFFVASVCSLIALATSTRALNIALAEKETTIVRMPHRIGQNGLTTASLPVWPLPPQASPTPSPLLVRWPD